jgi:hypothetical protein
MTRASSLPARPESTVYPIAVTSPLAIHLGGLSSPPAGRTSMYETDYAGAAAGKEVGFSLVRISPCLSLTWDP